MNTGIPPLKCAACKGPRTGISRVKDRSRKNALCSICFNKIGVCKCGCNREFPLYNGHGDKRIFFEGACHQNIPELKEKAKRKRSISMRKVWKTREYRLARENPDEHAKTPRETRLKNREKFKKLYHADPQKYLQMTKDHRKRYPEIHCAAQRRRYLLKKGNESTLTYDEWQSILKSYNYRCAYCNAFSKKLTQDHIIPLSKSGKHAIGNIVPSCMRCNRKKSDGLPLVPIQPVLL